MKQEMNRFYRNFLLFIILFYGLIGFLWKELFPIFGVAGGVSSGILIYKWVKNNSRNDTG